MKKKGFEYICTVDLMLEYMKQEIEFAINNKLEMATDFYILYKDKECHVCILNDLLSFLKSQAEIKTNIYFDNENYSSLDDFKNNAKLDGILIKDIKENLNIILTYTDSTYLEEHQIKSTEKADKIIFASSKSFCNVFLICAIFLSIFTIASRWMFKGQSGAIIAYIFFDLFAIFTIYLYIYYKKKKIVYEKDSITVYGIFKEEKYLLKDIVKVVEEEVQTKGITIYFKNNKRINFNFLLENYNDIKKILQQNNIKKNNIDEKVYIGRESVCMADDVNAPNMSSFILNNDLELFKNSICKCLPSADTWIGYKGKLESKNLFNEYLEGICIPYELNTTEIFSITIDHDKNILDFQIVDNWYKEIKDYPYLYLKRKKDM